MSGRTLAVRLDNDGDVLLTGPAVRALAAGSASVTLWCGPRGAAAAELLPGLDELIVHRAPWIDPEPEPVDRAWLMSLVNEVAARRFDRALVFTSFHQSSLPAALLLKMAGIPFVGGISEDYPGSLLDLRHRVPDDLHEVERSLSLVAAAGFDLPAGDDGALRIKEDLGQAAGVPFDGPYLVVHPGASVPARAWSPELNRELVTELAARGDRVVVTGGPSEAALTEFVAGAGSPSVADLGGRLTLGGLAQVLRNADAVVVGNTGPAHLAAAVGTPVVSLFAPTVPAVRWHPWRVPHVLLGEQLIQCAGCRARVCPVEGHPCLSTVRPAEVLAAVDALRQGRDAAVLAEAAR
ncbi:MAG TPA: glycosyltransferase family 9 protein [Actinomycetota bacterium]|nr:glycosyltransferase family 9 protein [Actinomycetota bacterium]